MNIETLTQIGGTAWRKNGHSRIYFNDVATLIGLECRYYGTGNISNATLDGEPMSIAGARRLLDALSGGRVWFDLDGQKFHARFPAARHSRDYPADALASWVISEITRLAEMSPTEGIQ